MEVKNNLTPMQEKAIMHGKGNAIVSASAGSGKTFVVIERIIRLIIEDGVSVDEILAVTFTKLAAQEMKEKLRLALTKKYLQTGDNRLKEQLDLIGVADISTIHSFCSKLIKKYFYVLGVDYSSKVVDESEKKRFEERAISDLFERLYDQQDQDFLSLIPKFSSGRSDNGLKQTVKELYEYCESEGSVGVVEEKTLNTYQNAVELLNSEYQDEIKKISASYSADFTSLASEFNEDLVRGEYCNKLNEFCLKLNASSNYFEFFKEEGERSFSLPTGKSKQKEVQAKLKGVVDKFKDWIERLKEVFAIPLDLANERINRSLETVKKLFDLTKKYGEEYEKIKIEENAVDFNDLERLAYNLLQNEAVKEEVQNTYKYVFVDEYQDVNSVQESIINLVSLNNAFLVGDSKQSIYAFRGCNPTYFKEKLNRFEGGEGVAISLDNNFRSASSIISAVNKIFEPIMSEDFGGTNYAKNPMIYGGGYGDFEGEVNLYHILKGEKKEEETPKRGIYSVKNSTELKKQRDISPEAKLVIKLVGDKLGKTYYDVKEKDANKRNKIIGFGDICILLRSVGVGSKLAEDIVSGLTELGVPVSSSVRKNIENYPEIKVLVNLISLLSCADRDVPLATVMLNLFDFSEDELATVRVLASDSSRLSFYECVKIVSCMQTNLGKKTARFLTWLDNKRLIAEFLSVQEVVTSILNETGYFAKTLASQYGERRVLRIERFLTESVQNGKRLKVSEFESHIEEVLGELTLQESSGEDTVKVMTMHASKGLEYPVVIVAGTSKSFNSQDRRGSVISVRDYGVAVKTHNEESMTVLENSARHLIKHRQKIQSVVEELRLFYVALTRAKCYLDVVVNGKDVEGESNGYLINSMSDFLTSGVAKVTAYNEDEILLDGVLEGTTVAGVSTKPDLVDEVVKNLSYEYPFINDITLPVKSSVSEINDSDEYYNRTDLYGSSSSEKGTAYHRVFELIDFYNFGGKKDIDYFVEQGLMTSGQAELIDVDKIERILKLDLFSEIKNHKIYKERKFCQLVPASEIFDVNSNKSVLVQGILDLVAVKGDEAVVIDYKISTIEKDEDLIKAYETQLKMYSYALEKILGVKVEKRLIVNVLQEKVIEV